MNLGPQRHSLNVSFGVELGYTQSLQRKTNDMIKADSRSSGAEKTSWTRSAAGALGSLKPCPTMTTLVDLAQGCQPCILNSRSKDEELLKLKFQIFQPHQPQGPQADQAKRSRQTLKAQHGLSQDPILLQSPGLSRRRAWSRWWATCCPPVYITNFRQSIWCRTWCACRCITMQTTL